MYKFIKEENKGWEIVQEFGSDEMASKGYYSDSNGLHTGIDLKKVNELGNNITTGAIVFPDEPGNVKYLRDNDPGNGFGKYIGIEREDGSGVEVLAHLDSIAPELEIGSFVDKTTAVGISGNTGNSTGPHLHKQIQKDVSKGDRVPGISADGNIIQSMKNYDRILSPVSKSWFMRE